tara:strand:- start:10606 stop:10854 length:249 start_codon:yes stop_codon:yes gene_type:complete
MKTSFLANRFPIYKLKLDKEKLGIGGYIFPNLNNSDHDVPEYLKFRQCIKKKTNFGLSFFLLNNSFSITANSLQLLSSPIDI